MDAKKIEFLRSKGLALRDSGEHDAAITFFENLLALQPNEQRAHVDIAISYRKLGNHKKAVSSLCRLLEKNALQDSSWKKTARKELYKTLIPYVEHLLATGFILEAKDIWELAGHYLSGVDQPEISEKRIAILRVNLLSKLSLNEMALKLGGLALKQPGTQDHEKLHNYLFNHSVGLGYIRAAKELMVDRDPPHSDWDAVHWLKLEKHLFACDKRTDNENLLKRCCESSIPNIRKWGFERRFSQALLNLDLDGASKLLAAIQEIVNQFNREALNKQVMIAVRRQHLDAFMQAAKLAGETLKALRDAKNPQELKAIFSELMLLLNEHNNAAIAASLLFLEKLAALDTGFYQHKFQDAEPNEGAGRKRVPKMIVHYWSDDEVPEDVSRCIRSWQQHHPDYGFALYNKSKAIEYIKQHYGDDELNRFLVCSHPAMESDFFRLLYLCQSGGVYVDADEFCTGRSEVLTFAQKMGQVFLKEDDILHGIWNGFIASAFGNKVLLTALKQIIEHKDKDFDARQVWWLTGPGALSLSIAKELAMDNSASVFIFEKSWYKNYAYVTELAYKSGNGSWQRLLLNA